jgi:hypothetical protein
MLRKIFVFIILIAMHLPCAYDIASKHCNNDICKSICDDEDMDENEKKVEEKSNELNYFVEIPSFCFEYYTLSFQEINQYVLDDYFPKHFAEILSPPPNLA